MPEKQTKTTQKTTTTAVKVLIVIGMLGALTIGMFMMIALGSLTEPKEDSTKTIQTISTSQNEINLGGSQEQTVEFTGTLELLHIDDFEYSDNSKDIYYLNVNGKRYELEINQQQPVLFGVGINVKGILIGDKVIVESLEKTSEKRSIDPWPLTLGDQKYFVVELVYQDESDFNVTIITETSFPLVNDWMIESSYGKASISSGYIGEFSIPDNTCDYDELAEYAIESADPNINFLEEEYEGLIVYYPTHCWMNYAGVASVGKNTYLTDEGEVDLSVTWVEKNFNANNIEFYHYAFIHEMGHNFGLRHAESLVCGEFPNLQPLAPSYPPFPFCAIYKYGDQFDSMGYPFFFGQFNVRNKEVALGWINPSNVPEVNYGTFLISPFEEDSTGTPNIHGLKVPVTWDLNANPLTHYFLQFGPSITSEMLTYLLSYYSNIEGIDDIIVSELGEEDFILIRLGEDDMYFSGIEAYRYSYTFLLNMRPNAHKCYLSGEELICETIPNIPSLFGFLREGETYYDPLNDMKITVLEISVSGALVDIAPFLCGDIDEDGNPATVLDLTYLVDNIFRGGPDPISFEAADLDGNGTSADVLDLVYLVDWIFRGGF